MSTEKHDPARGWKLIEEQLADDELARLDKMSDAEIEEEIRSTGGDPDSVPSFEALMRGKTPGGSGGDSHADGGAKTPPTAKVLSLDSRRHDRRRVATIAFLSLAAVFLLYVVTHEKTVIAWFTPAPTAPRPDDTQPLPPKPPEQMLTNAQRADRLREEAFAACNGERWQECESKLDQAKALDPDGESSADVQKARADAYVGEQGIPRFGAKEGDGGAFRAPQHRPAPKPPK